jgi:hypothetical protein
MLWQWLWLQEQWQCRPIARAGVCKSRDAKHIVCDIIPVSLAVAYNMDFIAV